MNTSTLLRILLALCGSFAVSGCLLDPKPEDRWAVLSARWVIPDSVLVYSVGNRNLLSDGKNYAPPRFLVFKVRVDAARKFQGNELLFKVDSAMGCGNLWVQDSIVASTYERFPDDASTPPNACREAPQHTLLFAGRIGPPPTLLPAADTVGVRALLPELPRDWREGSVDSGFTYSVGTDSPSDVCIKRPDGLGSCLRQQARLWGEANP